MILKTALSMKETTLVQKFSLLLFIALLLFGSFFAKFMNHTMANDILDRAKDITAQTVAMEIVEELDQEELLQPKTGSEHLEFSKKVKHLSLGPHVKRIKIWNKNHAVVWTEDVEMVGEKFTNNEHLSTAFGGDAISTIATGAQLYTKYHTTSKADKIMELYVPIRFGLQDAVETVVEVYLDIEPTYAEIKHHNKKVWIAVIIGFTSLYFLLFGLISNASRKINIQHKKQLETQGLLSKAEQDWEEAFNIINDAITIHDENFNIVHANKAAAELLGQPLEIILQQKCYQSYHGTPSAPANCPSCKALQSAEPSTTEIFEPHLNKYVEIKAFPRFDDDKRLSGLVHVVRDIDDRKRAELEVKNAYLMTREILGKSPFGIYVVNSNGAIEYVNPAMLEISGDDFDNFTKVNALELESSEDIELTDRIRGTLKRGKSFFLGPVRYTSNSGGKTTIRNFTGISLEEDKKKKAIIFVEDITERTYAEKEQQKLHAQLVQAQKMESIGRLAGGVAHDFNNILSAIIGYSELAMMEIPDDHQAYEDMQAIRDSGEKAAALTRQLLAFSRKQIMEMKVFNPNSLIDNMANMLQRLIGEDIVLDINTRKSTSNIFGDQSQMEQLIMNLAVNARDAMPDGGHFIVETENINIDEEFIAKHEGMELGSYVMLAVSDTGEGIKAELQEKIFDPFFTTKELGKGTGLGLAMVYGIVKQHKGFIYLYSEIDKGTTFKIFLPIAEREPNQPEILTSKTSKKGFETILVVEDDYSVRKLVTKILKPLGYTVIEARNGTEAIRLCGSYPKEIHLLLTDVIMPGMNGGKLSKEIKKIKPEIKIIFMSGYTDDAIAQHGVLEPGVNFIQKPLSKEKLSNKVRNVLDE